MVRTPRRFSPLLGGLFAIVAVTLGLVLLAGGYFEHRPYAFSAVTGNARPRLAAVYWSGDMGMRLGVAEAQGLHNRLRPALTALNILTLETSPWVMGAMTFGGGLILLLSGALPSVHGRMRALIDLFPLPFIEASHLAASLVGTALLLVAPALVARLESGMRAARLLFMLGAAFSLAKGLDFEEAIVMLAMAGFLQFSGPAFYRRSAGAFSAGSRGWLVAATIAVATASGVFAYRHLPYGTQLWWEFALRGDAPRFLRASFAVGVVLSAFTLRTLLHRPQRDAGLARLPDGVFARATAVASRSDAALALLSPRPGPRSASERETGGWPAHTDLHTPRKACAAKLHPMSAIAAHGDATIS